MENRYKEKILVTGCAGFIGMSLCRELLKRGNYIIGIDNLNNYYDVKLKNKRLSILSDHKNFIFKKIDISNYNNLKDIFNENNIIKVVNLAAQAGVRYSLENPNVYMESNVLGFMNILECCRHYSTKGLVYASSSSVYGGNEKIPFSEKDNVDIPVSIYAASKKANELMAHSYNHLFGLKSTGLRFFTVYGPWGRPDMAMYIFTEKILNNKPIEVFNYGDMRRDFTYIDDIVNGIISALDKNYDYEIFNLGNNRSEDIETVISIIEDCLGKNAIRNYEDMQPGDVKNTYADIEKARVLLDYNPEITIQEGIPNFIQWIKKYGSN